MARMVILLVDGQPARAFHNAEQAQSWIDRGLTLAPEDPDALGRDQVQLWDVPVGRSYGRSGEVAWGDE